MFSALIHACLRNDFSEHAGPVILAGVEQNLALMIGFSRRIGLNWIVPGRQAHPLSASDIPWPWITVSILKS